MALPSPKFAPSLPASKTSSSSSPTSIRLCWRPLVRNFFRGFGAVFYKEVLHVRRDPATLFFSLVIPLLQMVVLGFGIDTNIRQINTVVLNADGRRESRELIDRLKNSDTFHFIRYVQNDRDLNEAIIEGKARVGIKIPVDYSDRLLHNMSAQVLVLIDGSDSSVAGQAINVTTAIGLDESLRRVLHRPREGTRHARTAFRHAGSPHGASSRQAPSLSRDRFFRAVFDSHLHALRFSGSHSRQRSASRVPFSPVSFRFALHRHPRLQQSQLPVRSHPACLS